MKATIVYDQLSTSTNEVPNGWMPTKKAESLVGRRVLAILVDASHVEAVAWRHPDGSTSFSVREEEVRRAIKMLPTDRQGRAKFVRANS